MIEREIIRVRDVMLTDFDVVSGQATISEALASMRHPKTRLFIVNKRHEDDEYGIVRLGDIARQVLAKDRSPDRVNVYEIMSKPVFSVAPSMDIRYCARLLDRFENVDNLPVNSTDKPTNSYIQYYFALICNISHMHRM